MFHASILRQRREPGDVLVKRCCQMRNTRGMVGELVMTLLTSRRAPPGDSHTKHSVSRSRFRKHITDLASSVLLLCRRSPRNSFAAKDYRGTPAAVRGHCRCHAGAMAIGKAEKETRSMKRTIALFCAALAMASVAAVAAAEKPKTVTLSGCVQNGGGRNMYMLTRVEGADAPRA